MLRFALVFAIALVLGGLGSGLLVARLLPLPVPTAAPTQNAPQDGLDTTSAPETLKHLPDWVQTRRPATLWSGPDNQATPFSQLPAWTFLKVTGALDSRLRVEYAGDGQSRQPGPGWIGLDDVQPSDPSGTWLRNHRASHLFTDASGSTVTADVAQWSWMLALGETKAGRIHVRLYASSLHSLVADGWIPADDVGPSGPPQQSVYSASTKPAPAEAATSLSHEAFMAGIAAAAAHSPIPVSVTIAQAILESNWGQSALSREANNYFGIKATSGIGSDGAVWMPTLEYVNGGSYTVVAPFRAYRSVADSVADHAALLQHLDIYKNALQATNDPDEFARRIARAGYATDPTYADKLISLMQRYNLYQYDTKAPQPNPAAA